MQHNSFKERQKITDQCSTDPIVYIYIFYFQSNTSLSSGDICALWNVLCDPAKNKNECFSMCKTIRHNERQAARDVDRCLWGYPYVSGFTSDSLTRINAGLSPMCMWVKPCVCVCSVLGAWQKIALSCMACLWLTTRIPDAIWHADKSVIHVKLYWVAVKEKHVAAWQPFKYSICSKTTRERDGKAKSDFIFPQNKTSRSFVVQWIELLLQLN